jgi:hypothetical protein
MRTYPVTVRPRVDAGVPIEANRGCPDTISSATTDAGSNPGQFIPITDARIVVPTAQHFLSLFRINNAVEMVFWSSIDTRMRTIVVS